MESYQLPGLCVAIEGYPPRIFDALQSVFHICPKTKKKPDILLEGIGVEGASGIDLFPKWVQQMIPSVNIDNEPILLYGPKNQLATVVRMNHLYFGTFFNPAENRVQYIAGLSLQGQSPGILQPVLVPILKEIFLKRKRILIHSACVVTDDGKGLLIIAPGGGGKTTTALAIIRNGGHLLGDDLSLIEITNVKIKGFGIPELLNISDQTIAFFEEFKSVPMDLVSRSGSLKKSVNPETVYGPDIFVPETQIDAIYCVAVSSQGPSLARLPLNQAMENLSFAHIFANNQRITGDLTKALVDMLTRIPIYQLNTGGNPTQLGLWLRQKEYIPNV